MKRGLFILFIFGLLILLSSGIFALNDISCSIVPKSQCGSSYILMGLSDLTNAHGELASQINYAYVVCCNFAASTQCSADNDGNGIPDNKILGLATDTNAHAEVPDASPPQYTASDVCFNDLSCISTTTACGVDHPVGIASLSASTNAHIGPIDTYISNGGVNICCTSLTYITSAFWSKNGFTKASKIDVIPDKTTIQAILKNSQLPENTNLKVEIYEDDSVFDDLVKTITTKTDVNGKFVENWIITQADLDKGKSFGETYNGLQFFFKIFNVNDNNKLITSSDNLGINLLDSAFCSDKFVCGDYAQTSCTNNDPCGVAANSVPVGISCTDGTTNCFCLWDSPTSVCKGVSELLSYNATTGIELVSGRCIINANGKSGTCAQGGTISYGWTATWTGTPATKPASCVDGQTVLQCPAQIQLPFFGFYNFLITGLLIALIYTMLILRNKK